MDDILRLATKLCNLPVGYLGFTQGVQAGLAHAHVDRATLLADGPWVATWSMPTPAPQGLGELVYQILQQAASEATQSQPVVLSDMSKDARWRAHPLVGGEAGLRCFVGVLLHDTQRECIGGLALLGPRPHRVDEGGLAYLPILARQVEIQWLQASQIARDEANQANLHHENSLLIQQAKAKDEFMAAMSHELRTPLNTVLGMSEALIDGLFGPVNQSQINSLQQIVESGRHLLELVNDILDLAKVEAGGMALKSEILALEQVCESSLRFVRTAAMQKRIKLVSDIDPRLDQIRGDGLRLRQILVNLLSNAVKFTETGQITLMVRPTPQGDGVIFSVQDTGIGIPAEYHERLFQPFVQIDSRLSRKHRGTGLGLSLVKRLAELHGGQVSVQSEIDKGSTFSVHLPGMIVHAQQSQPQALNRAVEQERHDPKPPEVTPQPSPSPHQHAPLLLLAEDNQANIDTFQAYLENKGYKIVLARNGHEAIDLTLRDQPDLVLMDIQMPDMDGLEAIRRLRDHLDHSRLPILAVTSLAMSGDRERCLAAGATDYMSKPVSLRQLAERIENLLDINQSKPSSAATIRAAATRTVTTRKKK